MSRIKRYPPWFAAIHQKNEEARQNGMTYGQLVAADYEKKGRPRRPVRATEGEIIVYPSVSQANRGMSENAKRRKAQREANRVLYGKQQAVIREVRERMGLSKSKLAMLINMSAYAIATWENGYYPAQWDKLVAAMPELAEYAPTTELEENNGEAD